MDQFSHSNVVPNAWRSWSKWKGLTALFCSPMPLCPHYPGSLISMLLQPFLSHSVAEGLKFKTFQNFIHCLLTTHRSQTLSSVGPISRVFSEGLWWGASSGAVPSPHPGLPIACHSPCRTLLSMADLLLPWLFPSAFQHSWSMAVFSFRTNYSPSGRTACRASARGSLLV